MLRRSFLACLSLAVVAPALPAADKPVWPSRSGTDRYVEYFPGDLPIVFSSPHGGSLTPDLIPDRKDGVTQKDAFTQELAFALADALFAATGQRPHLIASHLHRRKLDPNREIKEAAAGNPTAGRAWQEYHDFIRAATAAAAARHGFAFLIDVHGHAHPLPRIELGYNLTSAQLNQDDRAFDASNLVDVSSLRDLHARLGGSGADLIRGPRSLGTLFVERGFRAVPSKPEPQPGPGPFFAGGYTIGLHARDPQTTQVDGVQFEHYREGLRDTAKNREKYAAVVADVLRIYLRERYAFELPTPATPAVKNKK